MDAHVQDACSEECTIECAHPIKNGIHRHNVSGVLFTDNYPSGSTIEADNHGNLTSQHTIGWILLRDGVHEIPTTLGVDTGFITAIVKCNARSSCFGDELNVEQSMLLPLTMSGTGSHGQKLISTLPDEPVLPGSYFGQKLTHFGSNLHTVSSNSKQFISIISVNVFKGAASTAADKTLAQAPGHMFSLFSMTRSCLFVVRCAFLLWLMLLSLLVWRHNHFERALTVIILVDY